MTHAPDADTRRRFEAVVESAYIPLQRYLRRRTDPATADDVLGDVLLVMWRRAGDVPIGNALPWCYGVARGCLANAIRSAERQRRLELRLAHIPPPRPPTDDLALDESLSALPETDRELLRLWAWEGLQPREIAVVLGTTSNAASIRLHRATRRLRNELAIRKKAPAAGQLHQREGTGAPQ